MKALLTNLIEWLRDRFGRPDDWSCRHCGGFLIEMGRHGEEHRECEACGRRHREEGE